MIREHFIFTNCMLFIILEYVYSTSVIIDTDMYVILSVTYIYISYSSKVHKVFNGSSFFEWLEESLPYLMHAGTVIYLVKKCELDHPTLRIESYAGAQG
jgi:hypothetical protein